MRWIIPLNLAEGAKFLGMSDVVSEIHEICQEERHLERQVRPYLIHVKQMRDRTDDSSGALSNEVGEKLLYDRRSFCNHALTPLHGCPCLVQPNPARRADRFQKG